MSIDGYILFCCSNFGFNQAGGGVLTFAVFNASAYLIEISPRWHFELLC